MVNISQGLDYGIDDGAYMSVSECGFIRLQQSAVWTQYLYYNSYMFCYYYIPIMENIIFLLALL
jgi:hypothetical protein